MDEFHIFIHNSSFDNHYLEEGADSLQINTNQRIKI
jgi:hypothetical protein